jgi:NitT/TauT family transport system substrate-binding protein
VISIVLVVIGISAGACQEKPEEYTGPVEKVTISTVPYMLSTLLYIADEQGFFTANALDVTLDEQATALKTIDELIAGRADIGITVDFVAVSHIFDNPDSRILGVVATSHPGRLIARKDRGIQGPADLEGKRIGTLKNASSDFWLGFLLNLNGMSIDDVELINTPPAEMVDALVSGNIDALMGNMGIAEMARDRLGENAFIQPVPAWHAHLLALSTGDWVRQHPNTAERLMLSLYQAEQFLQKNEAEAKEILRRRLPGTYDTTFENIWADHEFIITLPQGLILAMEDMARWKIENNITEATEVPNYLGNIYFDALEEVKLEAIGIIR